LINLSEQKGHFPSKINLNLYTEIEHSLDTLVIEINWSSNTGSKNAEAEHLCFKKLLKELMMGWYFFSQIWSLYFYKIVIEIFGYQMWISDCSYRLK